MNTGEQILRLLVIAFAVPAIAAPIVYLRGRRLAGIFYNSICPLLFLAGSALTNLLTGPPSRYTAGGVLFFAAQGLALAACVAALCLRSPHPALFWPAWTVNIGTFALLFYLSFFFRIF